MRDLSPPCFTLLCVTAARVSCYNSANVPPVCLTSSSYYAEVTQSISTYVKREYITHEHAPSLHCDAMTFISVSRDKRREEGFDYFH